VLKTADKSEEISDYSRVRMNEKYCKKYRDFHEK
jgi:hypothetical protein